jgi:hypothetical protein
MSDQTKTDRLFWLAIYRALLAMAAAIKQYRLGGDLTEGGRDG